jgi:uncharacterized membrane protein
MKQRFYLSARVKLCLMLGVASLVSFGLYAVGALSNHNAAFSYLPTNLLLAWIPLLAALWLERTLHHNLWSSWYALGVTLLWLVFLPNAFYMVSDYIHLNEAARVDVLYDVVMFTSFIMNSLFLGFLSLYIVHWELARRVVDRTASMLICTVLLVCSFAIYIGRELRWNTWDLLVNPASLLVDISDKLLNPKNHPQLLTTTISFFVLLATMYGVLWYIARLPRPHKSAGKE